MASDRAPRATANDAGYRPRVPRWLLTPRWLGLSAGLVAVVGTCAVLGWWQWDRATTEVEAQPPSGVAPLLQVHGSGSPVAPEDAGRQVELSGSYDEDRELLVVDRLDAGRSGAWVVTAFTLEGADDVTIPVVRGWIPGGATPPPAPTGRVRLVGWLEPSEPTTLRDPSRDPLPDGQVELVSTAELLSLWQPPLLQGFVIVDDPTPKSPLRPVSPPALSTTTEVDWQNLAYAIQWWLFGLFAIFWFVRMVHLEAQDRRATPDVPPSTPVGTIKGADQEGPA